MNGYVKLFRQLLEWEWYDDINVTRVFIHLLLTVNFKDKNWKGIFIKRGQLLTSLSNLASAVNLSVQQLRTTLDKLEQTGEINRQPTSLYTLITLVNFDCYQDNEQESNKVATSHQQASNIVATNEQQGSNKPSTSEQQLLKKDKNVKKDKKVNNENNKDILENVTFPSEFNLELLASFKSFLKMRAEIKKPFKSATSLQTRIDSLAKDVDKYGVEAVIQATNRSTENEWQGIKINWNKDTEVKPIVKEINKFTYDLPTFRDSEHRQSYFLARYETYKQSGQLDNYLVNTEYRQRAIYKQDAEGLCFELELQTPELLELEFNYTL